MISYKRIRTDSGYYQAEQKLRNEILLRPIGVPDHGWEMHDADSFHFVALDSGEVVGCAVLYPLPSVHGDIQLMQMAVHDRMQGNGIGGELVRRCISFARSGGFHRIVCHSRDNAVGFYERQGFECFGEPFEEVGILHRHMRYELIPAGGSRE